MTWGAVAFFRLLLNDPFMFLIGRKYGDAGLRWAKHRFTTQTSTIELLERWFKRAALPVLAVAPNNLICIMAGSAGIRWSVFLSVNLVGTGVRLVLLRWIGDVFSGPVETIRDFFDQYIVWTTAASILFVIVFILYERRAGRAEAETPVEMADDLEAEIEARTAAGSEPGEVEK